MEISEIREDFSVYQENIKKYTSSHDVATFTRWVNNEITIEECYEEFRKTNHITPCLDLGGVEKFERWLRTLGWYKDE